MTAHAPIPPFEAADAQPVPCLGCGAPMQIGAAAGLHAAPELACGYCGAREGLPADALARHQHLRLRLMQLKRAREGLEAPIKSYAAVKQAMLPGMVMALVLGGFQVFTQLQSNSGHATLLTLFPLAAFVGLLVGWVAMLVTFRRLIAPLMRARPATQPGLCARCRSCGGNLPPVRAEKVTCRFCSADNLLDAKLSSDVSELLRRESEQYFARARGERPDPNAYSRPARAFYVWGLAAAGATLLAIELGLRAL